MNPRSERGVLGDTYTALLRMLGKLVFLIGQKIPPVARWLRHLATADRAHALVEYGSGNVAEAIAAMEAAIAKDRDNPELHCDLGQIHYETGDYRQAGECFSRALRLDYGSARAQRGLGFSLQALGEYDEAIYFYLKLLHHNPEDVEVALNLAVVLYNAGKYEEAVQYYAQAEKLDPQNPVIPENRGYALYSLGRIDEAIDALSKALELAPDNSEAHRFLGLAWEAKGDMVRALDSYRTAVEWDPENADAHLDMGRSLGERGDHQEAANHDLRAARIFEELSNTEGAASAYWALGWDYYKLGDWADSIEASRKALEANPALYAARFNLGLALLHDGRQEEALNEYRTAVGEVTLASDLKKWAIDDLKDALKSRKILPGATEVLRELAAKHKALRKQYGLESEASGSVAA